MVITIQKKFLILQIKQWLKLKLPEQNVTLCFSFLIFGLNDFMPSRIFEFEKCLMKVASTLSKRLFT